MKRSPWLGSLGVAGGLIFLAIPRSETYSDYGLGINEVEVKCGNAFDATADAAFENEEEAYYYSRNDAIFDGQTAAEVCDGVDGDAQPLGWGAVGLGSAWLVIGLLMASSRSRPAASPGLSQSGLSEGAAKATNPPRWLPDPRGRFERRYWDGDRWTDYVANGGTVSRDPLNATTPPAPRSAPLGGVPSAATTDPLVDPLRVDPFKAPPGLSSEHVPVAEHAPGQSTDDDDGRTVPKSRYPVDSVLPVIRVLFDDGTSWEGAGPVLLGRDPAPEESDGVVSLHSIKDPGRSVSKTHVLLEPLGDGVRVVDRHSSNGTEFTVAGVVTVVAPGSAIEVPFGAKVTVGDRSFVIDDARSSR
jgi:hypothetical protein